MTQHMTQQPHNFIPGKGIRVNTCDKCGRIEQYMIHHGLTLQQSKDFQAGVPKAEIARKAALPEMQTRARQMGL